MWEEAEEPRENQHAQAGECIIISSSLIKKKTQSLYASLYIGSYLVSSKLSRFGGFFLSNHALTHAVNKSYALLIQQESS